MPERLEPFVNNFIYHVFNKTIDQRNIFPDEKNSDYFLKALNYYRSIKTPISLSGLKKLDKTALETILRKNRERQYFRVEILAYCIMPTHYHLLLKQKLDNGISRYISDTENSLTKYFNIKNERIGPIFVPYFKSVRILTEEQLKHVCRYIHLNPFSSGLIKELSDLKRYPLSSYKSYIMRSKNSLINAEEIMSLFNYNKERYRKFVEDRADYQKCLEVIKYAKKW